MPGLLRGVARTAVVAGTATTIATASRAGRPGAGVPRKHRAMPPGLEPALRRRPRARRRRGTTPWRGCASSPRCATTASLTDEEFAAEKRKVLGA